MAGPGDEKTLQLPGGPRYLRKENGTEGEHGNRGKDSSFSKLQDVVSFSAGTR